MTLLGPVSSKTMPVDGVVNEGHIGYNASSTGWARRVELRRTPCCSGMFYYNRCWKQRGSSRSRAAPNRVINYSTLASLLSKQATDSPTDHQRHRLLGPFLYRFDKSMALRFSHTVRWGWLAAAAVVELPLAPTSLSNNTLGHSSLALGALVGLKVALRLQLLGP